MSRWIVNQIARQVALLIIIAMCICLSCTSSSGPTSEPPPKKYQAFYINPSQDEENEQSDTDSVSDETARPKPVTLVKIGTETGNVYPGTPIKVYAVVDNEDEINLSYFWSCSNGHLSPVSEGEAETLERRLSSEKELLLASAVTKEVPQIEPVADNKPSEFTPSGELTSTSESEVYPLEKKLQESQPASADGGGGGLSAADTGNAEEHSSGVDQYILDKFYGLEEKVTNGTATEEELKEYKNLYPFINGVPYQGSNRFHQKIMVAGLTGSASNQTTTVNLQTSTAEQSVPDSLSKPWLDRLQDWMISVEHVQKTNGKLNQTITEKADEELILSRDLQTVVPYIVYTPENIGPDTIDLTIVIENEELERRTLLIKFDVLPSPAALLLQPSDFDNLAPGDDFHVFLKAQNIPKTQKCVASISFNNKMVRFNEARLASVFSSFTEPKLFHAISSKADTDLMIAFDTGGDSCLENVSENLVILSFTANQEINGFEYTGISLRKDQSKTYVLDDQGASVLKAIEQLPPFSSEIILPNQEEEQLTTLSDNVDDVEQPLIEPVILTPDSSTEVTDQPMVGPIFQPTIEFSELPTSTSSEKAEQDAAAASTEKVTTQDTAVGVSGEQETLEPKIQETDPEKEDEQVDKPISSDAPVRRQRDKNEKPRTTNTPRTN